MWGVEELSWKHLFLISCDKYVRKQALYACTYIIYLSGSYLMFTLLLMFSFLFVSHEFILILLCTSVVVKLAPPSQ